MTKKLKEKLISFDSKKENQITICIIAYLLFVIACIIFTNVTKQFEITCNIIRYIGICAIVIWEAVVSIRRKSKDIIMRNNLINIILSDSKTIFWYSYLIFIMIFSSVKIKIPIIIVIILSISIIIAIEIISNKISKHFNNKLK